jgi:uncharacterized repeat protein (TIGR03803 family)
LFELSPGFGKKHNKWSIKILHSFCCGTQDGSNPAAGLTYAGKSSGALYDGASPLYGTTTRGGLNDGGTIFQVSQTGGQWTETVLYSFCSQGGKECLDGSDAESELLIDSSGVLFGTTFSGGGYNQIQGQSGAGVAFQLASNGDGSWAQTVLYRFCSAPRCADGAHPVGRLVSDGTGALLGVARSGGACRVDRKYGCGVVFRLVPAGASSQESVLHSFCRKPDCADGRYPSGGVTLDSFGNLFGVTEFGGGNDIDLYGDGGGIVYELSGTSLKVLHRFCALTACADGEAPDVPVTLDGSGSVYGTATRGGKDSFGVIFKVLP